MTRAFRLLAGIGITVLFTWLILNKIEGHDFENIYHLVLYKNIAFAVIIFFMGYACRVERWRLMLLQENPKIKWSDCFGPLVACVAANNILPFRAGDMLRAFGFNKRLGISTGASITTLFIERLLDLLMIILFFGGALAYFDINSSGIIGFGGWTMLALALVVVLFLICPVFLRSICLWITQIIKKWIPKASKMVDAEFEKFSLAIGYISKRALIIKLIAWSFAAWLAEGIVFWLIASSIPTIAYNSAAWLALPVGTLATIIPSAPGFMGTFDYFVLRSMTHLGNAYDSSVVFALLLHIVLWLPPTIIGGLYFLIRPVKFLRNS